LGQTLPCLDELPSIAPLPTLRTRMANERALGVSFIWAAPTRAQLVTIFVGFVRIVRITTWQGQAAS